MTLPAALAIYVAGEIALRDALLADHFGNLLPYALQDASSGVWSAAGHDHHDSMCIK